MTSRKVSSYSIRNRNVPPLSLPLPPHAVKIQGHLFENALLRLFECRHNERHTSPAHGTASVHFKRPVDASHVVLVVARQQPRRFWDADIFQANRTGGGHGGGVGGYGAGGVLRGFPRLLWWAVVVGRGPRPSCWPSECKEVQVSGSGKVQMQFDARSLDPTAPFSKSKSQTQTAVKRPHCPCMGSAADERAWVRRSSHCT